MYKEYLKNNNDIFFCPYIELMGGVVGRGKLFLLIDWLWGNSKSVVPEILTIDTVYKYFIIPKNIRLIVEWSPQNDKDQSNHASLASILHYESDYCLMNIVMLFPQSFIRVWFFWEVDFNINVHGDYKFYENFELYKFFTFYFRILKFY